MKTQPIIIDTETGALSLQPAEPQMLKSFLTQWPMGMLVSEQETGDRYGVIFQQDASEVWGVKWQCSETTWEKAVEMTSIRQVLIPLALVGLSETFSGTLIPCAYIKQKGPNSFEHGITVFLPPLPEKRKDPAYFQITRESYSELWPALHDIESAKAFMQAYQQLIAHFMKTKELYIDVDIRPRLMMGELLFEFMLLDGKLVSLVWNPVNDLPYWSPLKQIDQTPIWHIPSIPAVHVIEPGLTFGPEDFLEIAKPSVQQRHNGLDVLVPGMICTMSSGDTSIGWDGRIWVQPIGCQRSSSVDPGSLIKLERKPTSLDLQETRRLWTNRFSIIQQLVEGVMILNGKLVEESEARKELVNACLGLKKLLARQGNEKEINGYRKKLMRTLQVFLGHSDAGKIRDFLKRLDANHEGEQIEGIIQEILSWTGVDLGPEMDGKKSPRWPPSVEGVPFIENTAYKRPKLLILYQVACSVRPGKRYSRARIIEKIEAVRKDFDSGWQTDLRFSADQLLRDMIDIGYLEDDGRRGCFWRKDGPRP